MATNVRESPSDADRTASQLESAAAEWFFRRDAGLTREEEARFQRWLHEDAAHAAAFAEIEGTWRTLAEAEPQVMQTAAPALRRRGRTILFPSLLAAAAALAIGCFVGWPSAQRATTFAEQAATEIGGLRRMDLPDGSFVTLNTNSAVDVQFTAAERRVRLLRGEAHFTVAPNPRQPFVVEASGVAVRAVGTAFNVHRRTDAVEVHVTEGKVRVDDAARGESLLALPPAMAPRPDDAPLLIAGERVVVAVKGDAAPTAAPSTPVSASEIEQAIAWQKRRLEYVDVPLSEIVADFNRYNQHRLVIPDARLSAQHFGGTFSAGDYASFVQLLESTFGVVVERRDRETVLRLP